MNKKQFLKAIRKRINRLPKNDIDRFLDFYGEMIDDRMEEGLSEEQAVKAMGTVDEIVEQILSETKPKAEKRITMPRLGAFEIVLLILCSPIWAPLLFALIIVLLAVYIVIWSVIIVFYAADITFAAGAVAGIFGSIALVVTGNLLQALFFFGTGFVCVGLTILWFFVCNLVAKCVIRCSVLFIQRIKLWFEREEASV